MRPKRKSSPFLGQLGAVCQDRLLDEKWLLGPSLRVGQQWLDSLTLAGMSVLNCRLFTAPGMALRFAAGVINELGVYFCNDKTQLFLVDGIFGSLSPNLSRYFAKLIPGLSLSKKLCSILNSLELAGLGPEDIAVDHFENLAKYEDVILVFRRYRDLLQEMKLVDYSDVLKIASQSIGGKQPGISKQLPLVIVPTELELCELESRLLKSLPAERVIHVGEADDSSVFLDQRQTQQERIRCVLNMLEVRDPERKINFYTAFGEANEIKEILRRCAAESIHFDEVEIVHTDAESYIPAIYETVLAACPEPSSDWSRLPVTFADGISAGFSRPGRALQAWIEWMRSDFPQAALVHMIEDGLLDFGGGAEDSYFLGLGRMLRGLVIVNGRERYLPTLRKRKESSLIEGDDYESDDVQTLLEGETGAQASSDWQTLYDFVARLLEISNFESTSVTQLLDNIRDFVSELALCVNEVDNYARLAILNELDALHEWLSRQTFSLTFDILGWARHIPNSLRILGSGPRPGSLHVSHVMNGGYSGRKHLFVVGLDEERFPGSPSIDPLLLDEERQKISDRLPTSWKTHEQKLLAFVRLLARQTGNICMSYSNADLSDDTSYLPSSVFQAARNFYYPDASGEDIEGSTFLSCAAFAPEMSKRVCTRSEWWLQRILDGAPPAKETLFEKFFPHFWRGLVASQARDSDVFTEYDGNLGCVGDVFDPTEPGGPILSVQKLETFAKCPLAYFFKYVLSATPPAEPGMEDQDWLDPLEMGSLLHEVFRAFIEESMTQGRPPLAARDHPRLHSILQQCVDQCKKAHPPPSMSALHRQLRLIEGAADIFLVEEEIASRTLTPRFVEVSIGLRKSGTQTDLDQETAENLKIDHGVFIRIRGKVDRIDESVDGAAREFIVWDYKTGGTYRYQRTDLFHQGRNLQHAIYTAVIAALLKRRIDPESRVSKFGYYFPSLKGHGVRIVTVEDTTTNGVDILKGLCRMMSRGCFPPTTSDKEDCEFCEYREVCGDVETVAVQSLRKIKDESNEMLRDFRLIRGVS